MDLLALALRVGLSLACVLGLIWLVSRGLLTGGAHRRGELDRVSVLTRAPLTRSTSVAVVQVGDRALVLGVSEQGVTLLTETDVASVVAPATVSLVKEPAAGDAAAGNTAAADTSAGGPTSVDRALQTIDAFDVRQVQRSPQVRLVDRTPRQRRRRARREGALAGSALSRATWTQAVDVLRDRTTRR